MRFQLWFFVETTHSLILAMNYPLIVPLRYKRIIFIFKFNIFNSNNYSLFMQISKIIAGVMDDLTRVRTTNKNYSNYFLVVTEHLRLSLIYRDL